MDLRLRVSWGGGTARVWEGSLTVQQGSLSQLSYLGLDADESATIHLDANQVHISQQSGRDYDGFDIQVSGAPQTVLTLELAPVGNPEEMTRVEAPLAELVTAYKFAELDSQNNQVLIQRVGGDQLRVQFERSSLVFGPGESFTFTVVPHASGLEDTSNLRCDLQLMRSGRSEAVWAQSEEVTTLANGDLQAIGPVTLSLPAAEGVYQIAIAVHRKRFRDTFVRSKPLLQRDLQLVVIAPDSSAGSDGPWQLIQTIDPQHASWIEWLTRVPKLPLLPDFRQEPLTNNRSQTRSHLGQELIELSPGGWQAYPTSVGEIGKPHILEVEYPSDVAQTLGISVIEPNAVGRVAPLGLDSGVDVSDEMSALKPKMLRHRLLFWPRTIAPLVLLTNRRDEEAALFGKIRVYTGPQTLAAVNGSDTAPPPKPRLLAAYFDRPLFPENFSAPEAADSWSGRSLKDWNTFYEGGARLVNYLKHVGYNGAIISVASQGGTIYPSELLQPIPKYDTGTFFASGQDPVQKDVLEMLFRLFDREGLTLVPAVHFSAALPELERLLRGDADATEGIRLVDRLGKTWADGYGANHGAGPHYNVLDPRVQSAMRRVLGEIFERYGTHRSFGGISLQLGPDTYSLLPGEQWGHDRVTLRRFHQETGRPAAAAREHSASGFRSREHQRSWLDWRARVLTQFYRDVAGDLAAVRPEARLYLAGGDLFTNPVVQPMLQPTIPNRLRVDEVLLQMGIVAEQFARQQQIILFRPERLAPRTPLVPQAVNINLATNAAADHAFAHLEPAASLFYHERLTLSLPSFDARSPFGKENTHTVLFTHATPAAESNRQRFVRHLALRDVQCFADGGWMLPLGQEDSLRSLLRTLGRLPAQPFQTVAPAGSSLPTQPLVVRTLARDGKTYIYVVNDSPWTVTAEIDMEASAEAQLEPLSLHHLRQPTFLAGQLTWTVDLEPFDLVAAVLPDDQAKVETWRVSVDRATYAHLRKQVDELHARALSLQHPDPIQVLTNPSFEASSDRLPGWIHADGEGLTIGVDTSTASDGQQSLRLASEGPVAWVRSDPFSPPDTGRIAVLVQLRTDVPDNQPPLRLAIDGKFLDGKPYYVPFNVGRDSHVEPIRADWGSKPFVLLISDLPSEQLANIRVGFDLMGAGNVWIDDVQVYPRWFPKNECDDLMIMRGLAARALSQGKLTDCRRILGGYWSQFLMQHVDPAAIQMAELPTDVPSSGGAFPPPQAPPAAEESSMLDKVKKRLPSKVLPFRLR